MIVKNLVEKDAAKIVNLIMKIYGKQYYDREYYDLEYIQNKLKEEYTFWKGAFIGKKLIGQMLFTIDHNAGYLKVTMVDPEFQGQGIATKIGFEMFKLEKLMNASLFKCVYAIISEDNTPIIKVLNNFSFKFLGRIPPYENNKGLIIFGLIRYDYSWKMIRPHLKLCPAVYNTIKSTRLKRIISASNFNINSHSIENYDLELIKLGEGNHEKKIILIRTMKGENIAEIIENQYQNSWYDFRFLGNNLSLINKKKVFDIILHEYRCKKNIHSISFPIPINDVYSQNILINSGGKFYAYLPFYYRDYDSILLGFSKSKKEVN